MLVPEEGIVDYKAVMKSMSNNIISSGGNIYLSSKIKKIKKINNKTYININSSKAYDYIINCTGLQADINYKKLHLTPKTWKVIANWTLVIFLKILGFLAL